MDAQPAAEAGDGVCRLTRDGVGRIISADSAVADLLGWRPDEMIGSASMDLVHPDDQSSALAVWMDMLANPGSTRTWRGRYRAANGRWRWVQTINSNHLDDPDQQIVQTMITGVEPTHRGLEDELRAQEQLLRRLADALPVGVFQVDLGRRIVFSNDRLAEILGVPAASAVCDQFSVVVEDDRPTLEAALDSMLAGDPVDTFELRFAVEAPHPDFTAVRVCQISLRALTDRAGDVTGAIGCLSDVTESVELRRELQRRASVDGLTGCLNRTAVFELLDRCLTRPPQPGRGVGVIFVDLDQFKVINDNHGHAAGDQALRVAAARIHHALRPADRLGRIGGDEFLVICAETPDAEAALAVAERICNSLQDPFCLGDLHIEIAASAGVAWSPLGGQSPDELIARADAAMYRSKLERAGAAILAP